MVVVAGPDCTIVPWFDRGSRVAGTAYVVPGDVGIRLRSRYPIARQDLERLLDGPMPATTRHDAAAIADEMEMCLGAHPSDLKVRCDLYFAQSNASITTAGMSCGTGGDIAAVMGGSDPTANPFLTRSAAQTALMICGPVNRW